MGDKDDSQNCESTHVVKNTSDGLRDLIGLPKLANLNVQQFENDGFPTIPISKGGNLDFSLFCFSPKLFFFFLATQYFT